MNPPPSDWAVRVFEAAMHVQKPAWQSILQDAYISQILLRLRVGTFEEHNLNGVKRYSPDLFRCHICNAVLRPNEFGPPDTRQHLELHRVQVRGTLIPQVSYEDWTGTTEPTLEEVTRLDQELDLEARGRQLLLRLSPNK